ncbi:hypothetical protein H8D36_03875 [archaeon]|nr:hypothetical protein [archaeon]MBL7057628.1 hypothetical protein [Candidatus Woesearchaeota archaeon]
MDYFPIHKGLNMNQQQRSGATLIIITLIVLLLLINFAYFYIYDAGDLPNFNFDWATSTSTLDTTTLTTTTTTTTAYEIDGYKTFSTDDFKVQYPEDWGKLSITGQDTGLMDNTDTVTFTSDADPSNPFSSTMFVVASGDMNSQYNTLSKLEAASEVMAQQMYTDYNQVTKTSVEFYGEPAYYTISYFGTAYGRFKSEGFSFVKDGKAYTLGYVSLKDYSDNNLEEINNMINSFRLI